MEIGKRLKSLSEDTLDVEWTMFSLLEMMKKSKKELFT
jgi:hypothetical protein